MTRSVVYKRVPKAQYLGVYAEFKSGSKVTLRVQMTSPAHWQTANDCAILWLNNHPITKIAARFKQFT